MVPEQILAPDPSDIERHLTHITRRWGELDIACKIETRMLTAEDRAQVKDVARFDPTPEGIAQAVQHIEAMNRHNLNAYVVINPVSATAELLPNRAAKDADIVASFFHWADGDDQQAADNIKSFVGPRPTYVVLTGTEPSHRPHVYWELEEPAINLEAWSVTQRAIAATLATDSTVVNPSRIMRVAGTVNWPKPQKVAKGYITEVTQIHIHDPDERPAVTSDRMARAFAGARPQTGGIHIATGEYHDRDTGSYMDILRRAQTDGEKHGGVRDLAASLAGQGVKRAMAEAIIRTSCPVWDEGVQKLIETAYAKFTPRADNEFVELSDEEKDSIPAAPFLPWEIQDLSQIPYPQFVYSDFYARGYTSVTLAPPKVGKSMLGLAEAIDMATGRGFLTGVQTEPRVVVYYNAEDDQSVINSRVAALLEHYKIDQSEIAGRLFATSGVDADGFYLVSGQEGVINEQLFVSIEKFIDEYSADALIFDPLQDLSHSPETNEVFRILGQRLRRMATTTGVALGLIHHTRKIAPGMTATIDDGRGGSALRGTARFNRLLVPMTEDEGAKAGVENHRHFLRVGDIESNLAPPSATVNRWFEKISVQTPNGHFVGAVKPWKWPDAFDGITRQDAARVRGEIDRMAEPPRADIRSSGWVGNVVADALGMDITKASDKAKIKSIVSKWVETDVLRITEGRDPRAGRTVNVVVCGANDPIVEAGN